MPFISRLGVAGWIQQRRIPLLCLEVCPSIHVPAGKYQRQPLEHTRKTVAWGEENPGLSQCNVCNGDLVRIQLKMGLHFFPLGQVDVSVVKGWYYSSMHKYH